MLMLSVVACNVTWAVTVMAFNALSHSRKDKSKANRKGHAWECLPCTDNKVRDDFSHWVALLCVSVFLHTCVPCACCFFKETQRALDKQKICFPRLWVDGMHTSAYSSVIDSLPDTTYYHNGKFPPNSEEIIKNCV